MGRIVQRIGAALIGASHEGNRSNSHSGSGDREKLTTIHRLSQSGKEKFHKKQNDHTNH